MQVRILCIGDIVGQPGRTFLARALPLLLKTQKFDFVVANAENAAGGSGLTPQIFEKLMRYGVDVVTLGDHCFKRYEINPLLESDPRLIRPANFPPGAIGRGATVVTSRNGVSVGVIALLGRLYMKPMDCPFRVADEMIAQLKHKADIILVEMHAEATSEKVAMGWYLDGRASVVFGTHTHVPTADATILPGGTAYITDLGMTGPYDSVLGRNKHKVIKSLTTGMLNMYDIAEGDLRVGALAVTVDAANGRAISVEQMILNEKMVESLDQEVREAAISAETQDSPGEQ
jgi:hypothetical protein